MATEIVVFSCEHIGVDIFPGRMVSDLEYVDISLALNGEPYKLKVFVDRLNDSLSCIFYLQNAKYFASLD